jgi:biofilm PGA synthesis N-glycosyltransferase PgaC
MRDIVVAIAASPAYRSILLFFALYPLLAALMWVWTGFIFYLRREATADKSFYEIPDSDLPMVSLIIPEYNEALTACGAMTAFLSLDYPNLEIIVCDDGSGDDTLKKDRSYLADARIRVIHKEVNQGKAMAINDAMPLVRGEYILIIDGDGHPSSDLLRKLTPHLIHSRLIGAVTANPRVDNKTSLLAKIQTVEFSSIISLIRRAQVVWGRVMTVSGICALYRKEALESVGLFVNDCATEDIATTWALEKNQYQIRYEPAALVKMQVPETFLGLWRQRFRWAKGLAQTLTRNAGVWLHWSESRLWLVYVESTLSVLWAYSFVALTLLWLITWIMGYPLLGATPVPSWWGMLIGTMSLVQLGTGVLMDRRYDKGVAPYFFWAALYPLIYWIQMSIITVIATPLGIIRPRSSGRWKTVR